MLIYEYSPINNYFTGKVEEITDDAGIPVCWTDEPVPEIPVNSFARYNNPGWILTDTAPPLPPDPPAIQSTNSTEMPVVL